MFSHQMIWNSYKIKNKNNCNLPPLFNKTNINSHDKTNSIKLTNITNLKILYLNARSIWNKVHELKFIIEKLSFTPDVVMITETWLTVHQEKQFCFQHYNCIFASRVGRKGGGACILVHKSHRYDILTTHCNDYDSIVVINLFIRGKTQRLINIYRPPYMETARLEEFFNKFENLLISTHRDTIITGDFNLNTMKNNTINRKYMNLLKSNGYHICNSLTPTRENPNACLDHIIVNNYARKQYINLLSDDISDHLLQIIEFEDAIEKFQR